MLSIKLLPVMACIFMLASSHTPRPSIKSELKDYYDNIDASIEQLKAHVLRLKKKVESLTGDFNDADAMPMDCEDVRDERQEATIESGLYLVQCPVLKRRIYCNFTEHETWTTISRRINQEDIFNRTWEEYKNGFGKAKGDYWIGNEMLYQLTKKTDYYLRITMTGSRGNKMSSYKSFKVMPEASDYRLKLGAYDSENSNGGDSFFPVKADCNKNGNTSAPFSTYDHGDSKHCSKSLSGGWWFTDCGCSNLNGKYVLGGSVPTSGPNIGLYWDTLYFDHWKMKGSLRTVTMEIRRIKDILNNKRI